MKFRVSLKNNKVVPQSLTAWISKYRVFDGVHFDLIPCPSWRAFLLTGNGSTNCFVQCHLPQLTLTLPLRPGACSHRCFTSLKLLRYIDKREVKRSRTRKTRLVRSRWRVREHVLWKCQSVKIRPLVFMSQRPLTCVPNESFLVQNRPQNALSSLVGVEFLRAFFLHSAFEFLFRSKRTYGGSTFSLCAALLDRFRCPGFILVNYQSEQELSWSFNPSSFMIDGFPLEEKMASRRPFMPTFLTLYFYSSGTRHQWLYLSFTRYECFTSDASLPRTRLISRVFLTSPNCLSKPIKVKQW